MSFQVKGRCFEMQTIYNGQWVLETTAQYNNNIMARLDRFLRPWEILICEGC